MSSVDKHATMVEDQDCPKLPTPESIVIPNDDVAARPNEGDVTGSDDDNPTVTGEIVNNSIIVREEKIITEIEIITSDLSSSSPDLEAAEKTADQDERHHRDPNEVDWDGPDDPECPMNWSRWRKSWIITILSVLRLLIPFASSMMAPAILNIHDELHSDSATLDTLSISIFMLGVGAGPLLFAPLSELYGRNLIYHLSNFFFTISSVGCAKAPSLKSLIGFRLLAGIAGSAVISNGGGTIADIVPKESRGLITTLMVLGQLIGPVIGPTVGGYVSQGLGWRWIFWLLTIVSGVFTFLGFIFLRETHAPTLLKWKAARLRRKTGNQLLYHKGKSSFPQRELFMKACQRPLRMLFTNPVIFIVSIYIALVLGYAYILFTSFAFIFQQRYGFGEGTTGLLYFGIGIGMLAALVWMSRYSDRIFAQKERQTGKSKAEFRLIPLLYGTFFIPVGYIIYGWAVEYHVYWVVPILATMLMGVGTVLALVVTQTYLIDAFTVHAASANAANSPIRCLAAALLPLSGLSLYDALTFGWGNTMLALIALVFSALPWITYRYGEQLRARYNADTK
ncbi:major facilitator superfamily domain-containing protein [Talaromyces proteolyticus]|uniref:Major facilitator superfamily domain-containing protein n=1 Tax=Talaromyces proteolyticus TaxID=1131652 RepID=A0AAD4PVC6_9EURO|nr:major facilitator superfamily domain-containing protein [Talaromyces proteolyticus]KAH8691208.1 major facilitator superfamily domain-containing protein [Talaromyces proteolyticus]